MRLSVYESRVGLESFSRDPIGYRGGGNLYRFVGGRPLVYTDPWGLKECKITIYGWHNFNVKDECNKDYPNVFPRAGGERGTIPDGEHVIGVGCGAGVDVNGDGEPDSLQDYFERFFPCNSVYCPRLNGVDDPINGLRFKKACSAVKNAFDKAEDAATRLCEDRSANPKRCKAPKVDCDSVVIEIKCDQAMLDISKGKNPDPNNPLDPMNPTWIPDDWWKDSRGRPLCDICGSKKAVQCKK